MIRLGNLGGVLFFRDTPIAKFQFKKDRLQYAELFTKDPAILPFEFMDGKINEHKLRCFWDARITTETRIGLEEELKKAGMDYYDPETIIRYQKGISIDDKYWLDCQQ